MNSRVTIWLGQLLLTFGNPGHADTSTATQTSLLLEQIATGFIRSHEFERYDGVKIASFESRARGTNQPGVCQRDHLQVHYAPAEDDDSADGLVKQTATRIDQLDSKSQFHILTDDDKTGAPQPNWQAGGSELEQACANLDADQKFFDATDALDARLAWHTLALLQKELANGRSRKVKINCLRLDKKECLERDGIGFDPFAPNLLETWRADPDCDQTRTFCFRFLGGHSYCSHHWIVEATLAWEPSQLRKLKRIPEKIQLKSAKFSAHPANQHDCWHDLIQDQP